MSYHTPTRQLTKHQARTYFIFKENTIYWKNPTGRRSGTRPAGYIDSSTGYRRVSIKGVDCKVHNIVYNYHNGLVPNGFSIDHIDRNKLNNSIKNLRLATPSQQSLNTELRCTNKSGVKGVSYHKRDKLWRVSVRIEGKQTYFGSFVNINEAIRKRKSIHN